jgi:hypothetical protein
MKELFEKVIKIESSMPVTLDDLEMTFGNGDAIPNLTVTEVKMPTEEDYGRNEALKTFQGTPCVGQERIAFRAGWREAVFAIKQLNNIK